MSEWVSEREWERERNNITKERKHSSKRNKWKENEEMYLYISQRLLYLFYFYFYDIIYFVISPEAVNGGDN
jgi:hypothetical protein